MAKIAIELDAAPNLGSGGPPRKRGGGWTLGMHGRLRGLNMKWRIRYSSTLKRLAPYGHRDHQHTSLCRDAVMLCRDGSKVNKLCRP